MRLLLNGLAALIDCYRLSLISPKQFDNYKFPMLSK